MIKIKSWLIGYWHYFNDLYSDIVSIDRSGLDFPDLRRSHSWNSESGKKYSSIVNYHISLNVLTNKTRWYIIPILAILAILSNFIIMALNQIGTGRIDFNQILEYLVSKYFQLFFEYSYHLSLLKVCYVTELNETFISNRTRIIVSKICRADMFSVYNR